jgi:hypothetical protein
MVTLFGKEPGPFLRRKLALGLGYALAGAAPFLGILAFGPGGAGSAIGAAFAFSVLLTLVVLTKYAFYPNALQIRITQAAVVGVALAMPGNPVYPALLAVALGGLWWQSRRRLRTLLPTQTSLPAL